MSRELLAMALDALKTCNSNEGDDPWYDHAKVYAARDADTSKRRHEASADCWCMPTLDYTDPETGASVYVHQRLQ